MVQLNVLSLSPIAVLVAQNVLVLFLRFILYLEVCNLSALRDIKHRVSDMFILLIMLYRPEVIASGGVNLKSEQMVVPRAE